MSYEPLGQGLWYFLTSFVGTLGFAILLHAPKRAWLPASLIGAMTYTLYWSLKQLSLDEAASMFLAALFGSLLAQFCARKMRMIATISCCCRWWRLCRGWGCTAAWSSWGISSMPSARRPAS